MACTWSLLLAVGLIIADSALNYAHAQTAVRPHPDSSLYRVLARISMEHERPVRIASNKRGRHDGRRVPLRADSLLLIGEQETFAIRITDIDSVWVKSGTGARLMGSVAGIACAVGGAAVGASISTDPDGGRGNGVRGAFIGGVAGGVSCGLVGAGLGSLMPRWRLEYARDFAPPA